MSGRWNSLAIWLLLPILAVCCKDVRKKGPAVKDAVPASVEKTVSGERGMDNVEGIRIISPVSGNRYVLPEKIEIRCSDPYADRRDSVQIRIDNRKMAVWTASDSIYLQDSEELGAGIHTLMAVSYYNDGRQSMAFSRFTLSSGAMQKYSYELLEILPHDTRSYTQGLFYRGGYLYEGTGRNGESVLRKNVISTGRSLQSLSLDKRYFGEGIAQYKDRIYQLTWLSRKCFVYDAETFGKVAEYAYGSEGWGLTVYGDTLVMSDGTDLLRFLDPETFGVIRELEVFNEQGSVRDLNELEFAGGRIWANVWHTDLLVEIHPRTGEVTGYVDLGDLQKKISPGITSDPEYVLNGIAYDSEKEEFYVTGKCWDRMFRIKILKP